MKITIIASLVLLPLLSHADILVSSSSAPIGFDDAVAAISKATGADAKPILQHPAKQGLERAVLGGDLSRLQYERLLKALKENPNNGKSVSDQLVVTDVATLFLDHPAGLRVGKETDVRHLMSLRFTEKPRFTVGETMDTKELITGIGVNVAVGSLGSSWLFKKNKWSWFHYRNHQGTEYLVLVSITDKLEQGGRGDGDKPSN